MGSEVEGQKRQWGSYGVQYVSWCVEEGNGDNTCGPVIDAMPFLFIISYST